ncbi:MAG TPA: hypothetical protein VF941_21705 [Clostridia bacterium]
MSIFNDKDIYKKVDIDIEKKDIDIDKKDIDIKKSVDVDINKKDIDINKKIEVKDNKVINNDVDVTKIDMEKLLKLWLDLYVNNTNKQQGENIILTNGNNNEIQIPNEQGPGDVIQK